MMLNDSPLKIAVGQPAGGEKSALGGEKSRPPRVLVVDDEALLRWSVAETLGDQGWQVTEAANARSAMVAFPDIAATASGLVFLDLRLPDSDDLQVLASMRRLSPHTPVILMTAHGTPDLAEAARALGAFAVLDKPFDMGELGPLAERASGYICTQSRSGTPVDTARRTS
jgi:DNA-binding NtrC family response regulator